MTAGSFQDIKLRINFICTEDATVLRSHGFENMLKFIMNKKSVYHLSMTASFRVAATCKRNLSSNDYFIIARSHVFDRALKGNGINLIKNFTRHFNYAIAI